MTFLNPEYFWLLILLIPLFIKKSYKEIGLVSYGYIVSFILISIALSRPIMHQEPIESEQILSDVVIAVDLSHSMSATDIKPSRLEHAKETLKKLVVSDANTRYAVIGFTTNAVVLSPLTEDSELLIHLYDALDKNLIITKGSSIMSALELCAKMSKSKNPSLVILSDGADEFSYENEAQYAKENGITVNVFMLATKLGSTIKGDNGQLLQDETGDILITRENDEIKTISNVTGGTYTKSFDDLKEALDSQKNLKHKTQTTIVQNMEFFYYVIFIAIVVFLITVTNLKRYVVAFLLFFGISLNATTNAEYFNIASEYYKAGEYEKALNNFEMVKSSHEELKSVIFYNIGNSFVRLKEFKKARVAYLKSLTLFYSIEADENMRYIKDAEEQMQMSTGQQKAEKKSSIAKKRKNSKDPKSGGKSNMKVSAPASSGSADMSEKTKSESMLNLNKGNAKLSSKQYELINKRGVNEKKPW